MLDFAGVNYWAVLVVWLLYLVIGAFWYSPAGFVKQWTKHTGVNILKIPTDQANKIIAWVALSGFVQSLTLALVITSLNVTDIVSGLATGFILWLGLTAATTVGVTLYSRKSWGFLWLNSSYFLLVMMIGSVIFSGWR